MLVLFTAVVAPALQIGFMLAIVLGARRERAAALGGHAAAPSPDHAHLEHDRGDDARRAGGAHQDRRATRRSFPGIALFALGALVFVLAAMQASFDPREVWARVEWAERAARDVAAGASRGRGDVVTRGRVDRDAARAAELRGLRAAVAPAPGDARRRCPRCGEELDFRKPGSLQRTWALADRRGDLLHPGEPAAGADDHHGRGRRVRHHPAGRRAAVVADRLAAVAHRPVRQHHDPERARSWRSAYLLRHRAARLDRQQRAARPALPDGRARSAAGRWSTCSSTPSPRRWCSCSRSCR